MVRNVLSSVKCTFFQSSTVQSACVRANSRHLSFIFWVSKGFLAGRRLGRFNSFFRVSWMHRTDTWASAGILCFILRADVMGNLVTSLFMAS